MARRVRYHNANPIAGSLLATLYLLLGLPATAQAQEVQGCQPNQYLDRTAPGDDREITWDFGITTDPERCLKVRTGQTVKWEGDLESHPLGAQGGTLPNPIGQHQNGSVTFTTPGTYGFVCLNHTPMKGAINVVLAPASSPAVPAAPPWLAGALGALLFAGGWVLIRNRQSTMAATRSHDQ